MTDVEFAKSLARDARAAVTLEALADGTGHRVRVRFGAQRRRFRIPFADPTLACARAAVLVRLGAALGAAKIDPELAAKLLTKAADAPDAPALAQIEAAVAKLAAGTPVKRKDAATDPTRMTMRELGEAWTDGELHVRYPDQIKLRTSFADDVSRLEAHVYPVIGSRLVAAVRLDDCEEIMRRLATVGGKRKKKLSQLTRRNVALTLSRLLNLAVYPLRLIPASPLPKGFLPKATDDKAKADYRPADDLRLLACVAIPLEFRLLWGFLAREGMREGEALSLRWADLDLEDGSVRLDENKTDDPRAWALDPAVARALAAYRKAHRPDAKPSELVFVEPNGGAHNGLELAKALRAHLRTIGLHETRPELFEHTESRRQIRVHDLRGAFVTTALANGRSEDWIADRTGHRSSAMLRRYKRPARKATELRRGDWTPLDVALGLATAATARTPPTLPRARRIRRPGRLHAGTAAGTDQSHLRDLNSRPTVYETVALPLS